MARSPTDIELMLLCQGGDDSAFDQLVLRHQRMVLNLVRRFAGAVPDAEDLAQEVFVRIYQARNSYRPTAKFTTYMYRNTLNLCLNYIRDRKHRKALSLESGGEEDEFRFEPEDRSTDPPLSALERSEAGAAVRRAVASLPDNQRAAVILSRWRGLSYQEIADAMEISVMAVKSLLSRAKENLRYKLSVFLGSGEGNSAEGGGEL